jgi:transaldolase
MSSIADLKIKLFADGADRDHIVRLSANPLIRGFTTNPTLMRAAGIKDYEAFAREVLEVVKDRPVSFEVFADEFEEMERQAHKIAGWADNVYVKIPITNTRGESSAALVKRLSCARVKLNVTALLTVDQVRAAKAALCANTPAVISIFAGRIADTGRDPVPVMAEAVRILRDRPNIELLWASPRELLNIFQADEAGVHIITATEGILSKLSTVGKDLDAYSLETVMMFYNDAARANYQL